MTVFNRNQVYYYRSPSGEIPIEKFLDSLQDKQQAKILRIFQYIKEYGLSAILPHTKKLSGTPLWEIRILGKDNIRYRSLETVTINGID
ncbi:type II toxin-antitoxin system RelE/ParE family toxin [Candidatus Gottesmanbacteria bacterium]|nr:type II toxin-antitoxin system RelE/ParE family toxin [Candidatus Gottesmanbacteria bacterium]